MKIKRLEETFKPITITIETEEEAERLWHILNSADGKNLIDYEKEEGFRKNELTDFKSSLFCELDEEYMPESHLN